jgi:hypothetical protein
MVQRGNYLKQKELNKEQKLATPTISDRFPKVLDITILIMHDQIIRTLHFWPSRHAYFNIACMNKNCVDGGYNLASVINKMIKKQIESHRGTQICKGTIDAKTSEHASINYKITIKYKKKK